MNYPSVATIFTSLRAPLLEAEVDLAVIWLYIHHLTYKKYRHSKEHCLRCRLPLYYNPVKGTIWMWLLMNFRVVKMVAREGKMEMDIAASATSPWAT